MTAPVASTDAVYYRETGTECAVFEAAARAGLPVMLKGPTGCGKTRLVEHMAQRLGVDVYTVSCHEDMTAADLLGRHLLIGGDTQWVDGPLTRAVRDGGICYLDEIVEARQDAVVAIHSLTDHRRQLHLERLGGVTIPATPAFMLVVSYNPGYQSILKDLKPSTRQRMVAIELDFPEPAAEVEILCAETGVDAVAADQLVRLAQVIRHAPGGGLREVASTRTLVSAALLTRHGLPLRAAAIAAIAGPLTDDPAVRDGLVTMVETYLP
jgi:nitric oxide reductase NorQ protein